MVSGFLGVFLVWIFIAPFLAKNLIVEKPLAKADAIFVLGGSATYLERCQHAAFLYKNGVSSKIFLTNDGQQGGWNKREERNPYFVEKAQAELISQGVPPAAIEVLPPIVDGTNEEARLFVDIYRERELYSVLLVTSAYHSRRTLETFEKAARNGLSPTVEIGISPVSPGVQTPIAEIWWLSPTGWKWIGGEYLKSYYYWLFD